MALKRTQERFLQSLLLGATIRDAAKAADISERTGTRWIGEDAAFQAERARREKALAEVEAAEIQRILTTGYAAVHERVKALDKMARELEKPYEHPDTGHVYQLRNSPEHVREWRACLDDIAKELGQRVKQVKQEVSGELDITGTRDALFHKIAAYAKQQQTPDA